MYILILCLQEVFQLIVSAFENLADNSSRSYVKRTSMLETVAKVRSVVIMMDLELDAMIVEMIEHFLKSIRSEFPYVVDRHLIFAFASSSTNEHLLCNCALVCVIPHSTCLVLRKVS